MVITLTQTQRDSIIRFRNNDQFTQPMAEKVRSRAIDARSLIRDSSQRLTTSSQLESGWSSLLGLRATAGPLVSSAAPASVSPPAPVAASAVEPLSSSDGTTSVKGFNLYSSSIVEQNGKKIMFTGGWKSEADLANYQQALADGADPKTIPGPDKIFRSEQRPNGDWTDPTLVSGLPKGGHLNDPSVITSPDDPNKMMMYYTRLDNEDAVNWSNPENSPTFIFEAHDVGFAVSNDGGKTWEDQGLAIERGDNGDPQSGGAWTPSALNVKNEKTGEDEVWLYYTTGVPGEDVKNNIFVQKFDSTGKKKLGEPQMMEFTDHAALQRQNPLDPGQYLYTNPEITQTEDGFEMVANNTGQDKIVHYTSKDGVNWQPSEGGRVLVEAEADTSLTSPFLDEDGSLHFGRSKKGTKAKGFPHFEVETIESSEAMARRIFPLIGRQPSQGDIDFWSDQLDSGGANETTMITSFLQASGKDHTAIVKDLYLSVLGHEANTSPQGLSAWVSALDNGTSLLQVVQGFIEIRDQIRG